MKFLRKSRTAAKAEAEDAAAVGGETSTGSDGGAAEDETVTEAAEPAGPYDIDEAPDGLVDDSWVDLGSLLLPPSTGKELRLQVDEKSGNVASVMLTAEDGALEVRAFAAPRSADLWSEALPLLREDVGRRGGQVAEREGPWGPEIVSQMQVQLADGQTGAQVSRMIGINGSRWMLRATMLGRPAVDEEYGKEWEDVLRTVVVRRGREAKPKGEALSFELPPQARKIAEESDGSDGSDGADATGEPGTT